MRKVKWIFFVYLSLVSLLAVALGVSLSISAPRDPQTLYNVYLANLKSLDPAVCNDVLGQNTTDSIRQRSSLDTEHRGVFLDQPNGL